jgi:hypothetical protein
MLFDYGIYFIIIIIIIIFPISRLQSGLILLYEDPISFLIHMSIRIHYLFDSTYTTLGSHLSKYGGYPIHHLRILIHTVMELLYQMNGRLCNHMPSGNTSHTYSGISGN